MTNKLYQDSYFSQVRSSIDHERSRFPLGHDHTFSMNAGQLIPYFIREVVPGSTFDYRDAFVAIQGSPLKTPIFGTAFFDRWLFYVPWRLVWEHTKEFFGENNTSAWTPTIEYQIPRINPGAGGVPEDSVADHMGFPTKVPNESLNAIPLRSYRLIWNEWFRDQNTQDPLLVNMGDLETDMTLFDVLPVAKRKDYFTSALPEPQKGPAVTLPLGTLAPVYATQDIHASADLPNSPGLIFYTPGFSNQGVQHDALFTDGFGMPNYTKTLQVRAAGGAEPAGDPGTRALPRNLWADLSAASSATINDLRVAFAVQGYYEMQARSGSRYREFLRAFFGVTVPDLTVQVPEFLAGESVPLNVQQVVQTSATEQGVSAQGNLSGFSKTVDRGCSFTYSFAEPGFVIGVCAIRTLNVYQQGIEKFWSRRTKFDVFNPMLEGIGEQPILNKEIYAYGNDRDEVFGYQEPFADYRTARSYVSGAFRSNYSGGSLDYWTYVSDFDGTPRLSDGFIRETDQNIARSMAIVDTDLAPQFLVNVWFDFNATMPMKAHPHPVLLGGAQ